MINSNLLKRSEVLRLVSGLIRLINYETDMLISKVMVGIIPARLMSLRGFYSVRRGRSLSFRSRSDWQVLNYLLRNQVVF